MANTRWVKTPREIETIEERLAHPAFLDGKTLTVTCLTRPELVRATLPPPLEPADEPLDAVGRRHVRRIQLRRRILPAGGGLTFARATRGIEANYCLAMPMSTDVAIIFGRELFGEPKKQGRVRLESDGGDVTRGVVERFGIMYLSVEARLTENLPIDGPAMSDRCHFKVMHSADGRGLDLIRSSCTRTSSQIARPKARAWQSHLHAVASRSADRPGDPGISWRGLSEGDVYARARRIGTVDANSFLPYAFQNIDDYSAEI